MNGSCGEIRDPSEDGGNRTIVLDLEWMVMSVQSPVGLRQFASRGLLLSFAVAASIAGGSLLWAESDEFFTETASVVVFRAKPSMSRQPRPLSAPLRQFDQRVGAAVVLLGIEAIDEAVDFAAVQLPMGEWTPRH